MRYNGKFEIINRAEIILEHESEEVCLKAKQRGEEVEKENRDYFFAALAAYEKIKQLMENKVAAAIRNIG